MKAAPGAMNAPTVSVNVDPQNPGQFFGCCGLLELATRAWGGARGWFSRGTFHLVPDAGCTADATLASLVLAVRDAPISQLDERDDMSSPMLLGEPFNLTLDWWKDARSGGNRLKVWAGSMRPVRIAMAMQAALTDAVREGAGLFDYGSVVFDPEDSSKKVEPYYFDSRRGLSAQSRDIGFAPDALQMTTTAFPAVEFFCLVGLQRSRPVAVHSERSRIFEYHTWETPCRAPILPVAVCGLLTPCTGSRYRFENSFRTDQKKHKAFLPAELIGGSK